MSDFTSGSLIEPLYCRDGVAVDILRLDKFDALAPGNKWFKLAPNLAAAQQMGCETLVSFGGAYSNHLHALAAVGKACGLATVGCVRADEGVALSPTLQDAEAWGMRLHYLSRTDYRRRHDPQFVAEILAQYEQPFLIPEGGANSLGAEGCAAIAELIPNFGRDYGAVVVACGTGTTLAGLAAKVVDSVQLIGIPVLKAEAYMAGDISKLLTTMGSERRNWRLDFRFHGGAYARLSDELRNYMLGFEAEHGVVLDPVYTAKMMWGLEHMLQQGEFAEGSRVLAVHSGGLQGRRGFPSLLKAS
ncbi:1-aminocyclopropane-1-carboxylate deaminase/D-cysteine desulfhydrase [Zhongshania guokunii]|uniref:1-aminocyclopropane-1-carboxylate deaminase/D-cysteine desulfhydrase n=1 Tax=Zhongshania guokunii TaxID=641783 RepID=A0ABV3U633_9GAMM